MNDQPYYIMKTYTSLLIVTLMMQACNLGDTVPKHLPGIPTNAAPYSDYAPYLCYPGSDKYYSFPGIGG